LKDFRYGSITRSMRQIGTRTTSQAWQAPFTGANTQENSRYSRKILASKAPTQRHIQGLALIMDPLSLSV
jgi:hypothetical protein